MKICTLHPHSSPFKALKCYLKAMRRRVEIKTRGYVHKEPAMVTYTYPRKTVHGKIEMTIFSEDANMKY